jgi:hypothetical protein
VHRRLSAYGAPACPTARPRTRCLHEGRPVRPSGVVRLLLAQPTGATPTGSECSVLLRSVSTSGSARCLSSPLDTGQGVAGRRRVSAQPSEKGPKDEADLVAEKLVLGKPGELTGDMGGDQRLGCEVVDRPPESARGSWIRGIESSEKSPSERPASSRRWACSRRYRLVPCPRAGSAGQIRRSSAAAAPGAADAGATSPVHHTEPLGGHSRDRGAAGTSCVTTAPAPTSAPAPIRTPPRITAPEPTVAPSSTTVRSRVQSCSVLEPSARPPSRAAACR